MTSNKVTCGLVIAAALAGGCGGSDDGADDAGPEDVVRTYLEAVADGDGERACDQLTDDVQRQAVDFLSAQLPQLEASSCADGLGQLAEDLGEEEKDGLRDPGEASAEIDGDTAIVRFEQGTTDAELTKEGDSWLISGGLFE